MHRNIVVASMKERRLPLTATAGAAWILVLVAVFHAPLLRPTQAQDDGYGYCVVKYGDKTYFSSVYSYSNYGIRIQAAFSDFLRDQYNLLLTSGDVACRARGRREEAEASLNADIRAANRETVVGPEEAIQTHWTPDGTSNSNSRPQPTQPIEDFHIAVPPTDQTVRVCVRDHECEDGDRVRVSVNGSILLSGEIVSEWACGSVPVSAGRNRIELYAINGTGRKGNCSYGDVNTGELRVEGQSTDTQTWRHRGGAGSSASIVVTVR